MKLTYRAEEALKLAGWVALVVLALMFITWMDGTPLLVVLRNTGFGLLALGAAVVVFFVFTWLPLTLIGKWIPDWLGKPRF